MNKIPSKWEQRKITRKMKQCKVSIFISTGSLISGSYWFCSELKKKMIITKKTANPSSGITSPILKAMKSLLTKTKTIPSIDMLTKRNNLSSNLVTHPSQRYMHSPSMGYMLSVMIDFILYVSSTMKLKPKRQFIGKCKLNKTWEGLSICH